MTIVYRTELLESELSALCQDLNHIQGAVIVSIEGFVVAAHVPSQNGNGENDETDSPQIAAMAATLLALSERTLTRLAQGNLDRLLLEGEAGAMLIIPAGKNAAVALMVDKNAKMGFSLYKLKKSAKKIQKILEGQA